MINYDLHKIKAVFFDVDGVLSRETIPMHPSGEPMRTVNIKDGYAMQLAVKRGLLLAVITGANTEAVRVRYEGLGLKEVIQGASIKLRHYDELLERYNLKDEEVMYVGDDIPDYEVMKRCGVACCPADAAPEIQEISTYISPRKGGEGVARDVLEHVLKVQGLWMDDRVAFGW